MLPPLDPEVPRILGHLCLAILAGGAIGIERSYHGRPAGFRTHALVCLASSLLMLLTLYQQRWFPSAETVRLDPTRMAQGIMTGIGFLGAGVIFKEGITVRGLTTAASIWITSAIGVMVGSGMYFPALAATGLTLGVLSGFRLVEARLPAHQYAAHRLRFDRADALGEDAVRALLARHGCKVSSMSWRLTDEGRCVEYRMTVRTSDARNFSRLAAALQQLPVVREFLLSPAGD